MGDVIPFIRQPKPIEAARDLLNGMADLIENLPVESQAQLLRDVLAERVSEAHDILQDHIETLEGK